MKKIFVDNWSQVYKSLAVWLPVLALIVVEALNGAMGMNLVPDHLIPVVAGIAGALGWMISQNNTVLAIRRGRS